jgi:hypothetical protein
MFYADAVLQPGARIELAPEYEERSLYVLEGLIAVRDRSFVAGQMVMLHSDATVVAATDGPSRLLTLGGARHWMVRGIYSGTSCRVRVSALSRLRMIGGRSRFASVPGETEQISLPE